MDKIKGKPLTIKELKALEVGDWVWAIIKQKDSEPLYGYFQKTADTGVSIFLDGRYVKQYFDNESYGIKWIVYKNKEEAENANRDNSEQAVRKFAEKQKQKINDLSAIKFTGKTRKQLYQRKGMEEGLRMAIEISNELIKELYGKEDQNQ